jgi:hypothetical protein
MQVIELIKAYRVLFEENGYVDSASLKSITIDSIKSVYKKMVFKYHPDMFYGYPEKVIEEKKQFFVKVVAAYEVLIKYVMEKNVTPPPKNNHNFSFSQKSSYNQKKNGNNEHAFGNIPKRNLKFAEFLYYKGVITWNDLIKSVTWQRMKRDKIGEIALRWHFVDEDGLFYTLRKKTVYDLTGELLINNDLITSFQLKSLLFQQRKEQPKIGEFFVINNILTNNELIRYLYLHQKHNEK